jgi:molecular chaperone DnaK (HSP70)
VTIGDIELSLLDLTTDFLVALRTALVNESNLPHPLPEPPEVVVSVPANAHSSQRFTTLEAFGQAGFVVRAMINEPSAAAIEFAHRHKSSLNARRDHVCVYDLGGGTFDAALVLVAAGAHEVIDTSGVRELGGDDFDVVLMEMALEKANVHPFEVPDELRLLLDECRAVKESIGAHTKRLVLELEGLGELAPASPIVISVADYYARLAPLVERSIDALGEVMSAASDVDDITDLKRVAAEHGVAGVYVVGGGSGLPVVARALRERFGRRVHRSAYPAAATAIGLAIAADTVDAPKLTERFTRHFGVFRELDRGRTVAFDSIFARGTPMPKDAPLVVVRRYRPQHNVGHFRFIECASLDSEQHPAGDVSPHKTIRFSYDRATRQADLEHVAIRRLDDLGPLIEERFLVDPSGVLEVTIRDETDGYEQHYVL